MGKDGVFEGARSGAVLIVTDTVGSKAIQRIAEVGQRKGIRVLGAPVVGRPPCRQRGSSYNHGQRRPRGIS